MKRLWEKAKRHRFINADSYASTGQGFIGTNMFAYCNNNPVNRTDEVGTVSSSTEDNNNNGIPDYLEIRWREQTLKAKSNLASDQETGFTVIAGGTLRAAMGVSVSVSVYDATPFMVMLPSLDKENNVWSYDVAVSPKFDRSKIPGSSGDDTITRKVLKVWEDKGQEKDRPEEVIVQLLRDGKVFDTVTLNAANNWRYTWTALDNGYSWTVVEKETDNYTVEVTQEGITFVVKNTHNEDIPDEPTTPTKPTLPQTGQLWWPVPVLIAAGLLFVVIGLLRRRGAADEK